ncbi:MAG: hypothetical protein ACREX4_02110 [Gammaproteobacteria bacterium]
MNQKNTKWKIKKMGLLAGVLLALIPASASANGPPAAFAATGPILGIDEGDIAPAGSSGRFVVKDRTITGKLFGSIGGDAGIDFAFTFGTNVPLMTQSGQLHGSLIAGLYEAKVHARSQIGVTPIECGFPDGVTCIATPGGNFVPGLLINGRLTLTAGTQGHGNVSSWVIPELDSEGHIIGVFAGHVTLTGQWHQ